MSADAFAKSDSGRSTPVSALLLHLRQCCAVLCARSGRLPPESQIAWRWSCRPHRNHTTGRLLRSKPFLAVFCRKTRPTTIWMTRRRWSS